MIQDVRIPEISENVAKGTVASLLVKIGDTVKTDQGLLELETDKAVVELPSPAAGTITEILVSEGETILVGAVVMKLDVQDSGNGKGPDMQTAVPEAAGEKRGTVAVEEPSSPESMTAPVSSSRAETRPQPQPVPAPSRPSVTAARAAEYNGEPAPAGPAVRKLARELGVDLFDLTGSGPHGRILEEDVKQFAKSVVEHAAVTAYTMPDLAKYGPIRREPVSRLRLLIARAMSNANTLVPQVTQFQKADITGMEEFRTQLTKPFEHAGLKLTATAIVMRIVAEALKKFPRFNAAFDTDTEEIVFRDSIHISVAVDTERGLLVPVVRDVDRKDLLQLAKDLAEISQRARDKKTLPDEMEGGTFAISNQGSIGGEWFTPIVNPPQVAILGMSRSQVEPRWIDGAWQPRTMLPLTLSYDHRVVDGADAARFLDWVCKVLEHPMAVFL